MLDDGLGLFVLTVIILLARGRIASLDHDYRYLYNIQIVYKKKKFWYRLFIIKKSRGKYKKNGQVLSEKSWFGRNVYLREHPIIILTSKT